jgi:hypothetical protein
MNAETETLAAGTVLVLLFWGSLVYAGPYDFAGGTGEPNDPYQIATAEQLVSIGSDPNLLDKHFVLLNDIDLDPNLPGGRIFTHAVIAPDASPLIMTVPFTGRFDGRGRRIRNMIIRNDTSDHSALIGRIGEEGVVTDLGIDGAQVAAPQSWPCAGLAATNLGRLVRCSAEARVCGSTGVGVLVGSNLGEIIECWSAGEAIGDQGTGGLVGENWAVILRSHAASRVLSGEKGRYRFGGLVGESIDGLILDCYATGAVSAQKAYAFGGLVGEGTGGAIVNSYATGDVSVELGGYSLGGLVGNADGVVICDCYATGDVNGVSRLGGLIGNMGGYVANSYSTGRVAGDANGTDVGGLVGYRTIFGTITGCFWNTETSGLSESAVGVGLTTAEMQNVSTFLQANWDWTGEQANGTADPWFIPEGGGYPQLTVHSASFQKHKLEGSGTPNDPYRIVAAEDWGAINHYDLGACYRLEADISVAGIAWRQAPVPYFEGRLDGAGKIVTGLKIEGTEQLGLFGRLGRQASVENLGIRDAEVKGMGGQGVLAGENWGRITACYAWGVVAGGGGLGALVGWNEGSITDSYAIGTVTASYEPTGALTARSVGTVRRCYAAVQVTCSPIQWPWTVPGGLVGTNQPYGVPVGAIEDSYFLIDTDGGAPDNGLGVALTGVQMKQQASFPGWDFDATWTICEGKDYPRLRWENPACEE